MAVVSSPTAMRIYPNPIPGTMEIRRWLPLAALVLAALAFCMSEFMPMGVIQEIAWDLDRPLSELSLIISAYAWVVAILSVPLVLLLRSRDCKILLLGSLLFYSLFLFLQGS